MRPSRSHAGSKRKKSSTPGSSLALLAGALLALSFPEVRPSRLRVARADPLIVAVVQSTSGARPYAASFGLGLSPERSTSPARSTGWWRR